MPIVGPDGAGSAAVAAAARERAEAQARQRAEAQRKAAEAAQKAAQKAQEAAQRARTAATDAHLELGNLEQLRDRGSGHAKQVYGDRIQALGARVERLDHAAQRAQAQADRLTQAATSAATRTLTAEQAANTAAGAAGDKAPYAPANQVQDVYGAKSLTAADQKKLFGAPLALTSEDAARVDAARLAQVKDPAARAKLLATYLAPGQDPKYQQALLEAAKPEIQALSQQICDEHSGLSTEQRQKALETLTRLSEALSPDAQKTLAQQFAEALPDHTIGDDSDQLGAMIQKSINDGAGVSFGVRLVDALQSTGKPEAANDTAKFVNNGVSDVKKQFDAAQKEMDEKNAKLAPANSYKDTASPKEEAKIVQETKKKIGYEDTKKKYEAASAKMASLLNGADLAAWDRLFANHARRGRDVGDNGNEQRLAQTARSAIEEIPKLSQSEAGSKAIQGAVEAEGEDRATWLEHVSEYGEQAKGFIDGVRGAVIESVGARALSLARSGDLNASRSLFRGVSRLGGVFGASDAQMSRFATTLAGLRQRQGSQRLRTLTNDLARQADEIAGDPNSKAAKALKGLGAVFGIANAYSAGKDFSDQDLQGKVNTVTSVLGTSKEVAQYITGATSRYVGSFAPTIARAAQAGGDALETLSKGLDPALQLVGAVSSAVDTYNDFKNGDIVGGVGDSVSTAGQLISGLTEAIPGVDLLGQGVGDALTVLGQGIKLISGLFSSPPDPFAGTKDGIKQGLIDSGFPKDTASQLAELHGDGHSTAASFLRQVAESAGISPSQLLDSMKTWSSHQVRQFLDVARLSFNTDDHNLHRALNASLVIGKELTGRLEGGDKAYRQHSGSDGQPVYNPRVVDGAASWLFANGLIPPPPSAPRPAIGVGRI